VTTASTRAHAIADLPRESGHDDADEPAGTQEAAQVGQVEVVRAEVLVGVDGTIASKKPCANGSAWASARSGHTKSATPASRTRHSHSTSQTAFGPIWLSSNQSRL
jgi:hypothetical protein